MAYPGSMLALFDHGPFAACPAPFNLTAHVLAQAAARADHPALEIVGAEGLDPTNRQVWTYGALNSAVLGTATGLLNTRLKPGDILLMRLGNTVDFPIAYLAAIAVGIVPVPTSAQLTEAEVQKMIDQLDPAAILRDPAVSCPEAAPSKAAPSRPILSLSQLQAMRDNPPAAYDMGDPNRLAYIIYTSGTSGAPRAVMHAHRAIWARQMMHQGWYGLAPSDRLLHAGAFNWTFTLGTGLMDPWSIGATALIPHNSIAIPDLPRVLRQNKATLFAAAPGVYRKILQQSRTLDLPDLRHGLCAGEKLSGKVHEDWHLATGGKGLFEAYGMSECSTFISSAPVSNTTSDVTSNTNSDASTLGRPQPGRRVAITDQGRILNTSERGEISIHADDPGLMLGYFGAEQATRDRYAKGDDSAWFLTGDLGIMQPNGDITYQGRNDDMMNAGGYRVSPLEVEQTLCAPGGLLDQTGITGLAVTDVEVKTDSRLIACFYTAPQAIDDATLSEISASILARYKQPRIWLHVAELPVNPNGKLSRGKLRDHYAAHRAGT